MLPLPKILCLVVFLTILDLNFGQQSPEIEAQLIDIFGPNPNISTTTVSGAPIYQGGDGRGRGDCICVPYYNCDSNRVITNDGKTDGFGIIDIRFGQSKCSHFLDLCCTYPDSPQTPKPSDPNPDQPDQPDPEPVPITPVTSTTTTTHRPLPPITIPPTLPPTEKIQCGVRNPNGVEFDITGNTDREAAYGEFPWMVALLKKKQTSSSNNNIAICGGSLIHPKVVLTGAHCVYNLVSHDIKIRAGEWDTQTEKERYPYQERDVEQIIINNDFHKDILLNDIALLVLKDPVTYAPNVKPVCLPEQDYVYKHNECYASGWGKKEFGKEGSRSVILKKIDLPIVDHHKCQDSLRKTRLGKEFQLHRSFICAGGIAGKDTCTGDGGSPLVCPDPGKPGRYSQAGIVAWGIGCGDNMVPGVYANVGLFRKWIDAQMEFLRFDTSSYIE